MAQSNATTVFASANLAISHSAMRAYQTTCADTPMNLAILLQATDRCAPKEQPIRFYGENSMGDWIVHLDRADEAAAR